MGKALVAHAQIRKTVRTVTVVLFDANMTRDFTVNLTARAAEQGFAPSTTSGRSDGFKRLYLPENGGEKIFTNILSLSDQTVDKEVYLKTEISL